MFCKYLIIGLIVFVFDLTWSQLIRPVYVYEGLIKSIRDYFNNTCIVFLHSNSNLIETQGENNAKSEYIDINQNDFWHASVIDFSYIESSHFAGLMENEHLLTLQRYLSVTHHIRTTFMDFHMFSTRVSI